MCEACLHWTEYLQAIGPTLIAIFVAWIAFQQWRVNQANLRERLFERRMKVLEDTRRHVSALLVTGKVQQEDFDEFTASYRASRFLFGKDIEDYLQEIWERSACIQRDQGTYRNLSPSDERKRLIDREYENKSWLGGQLSTIHERFEPWLSFSKHN